MAVRYITKGKGRRRRVIPLNKKKKGVTVRSVSLQPSVVGKVNKEQIKLLNRGQTATFSKALNQVVMRARREGVPVYDTHVNSNDRRKPYHMWIVKHPEKGDKIKGSDTIVMAEHYGQAIDDMITIWNKEKRKKMTIGYPQVQGTAERSFRYARDTHLKKKEEWDKLFENATIKKFKSGVATVNGVSVHPNFHKSGSIRGMRDKYYGNEARLEPAGNFIYNVSSLVYHKDNPDEMMALKLDHFKDEQARRDLASVGLS